MPAWLIPLALSLASAGANKIADSKAQSARNSALAAERIRQGQLDQEAAALQAKSQAEYANAPQDMGQRNLDLRKLFEQEVQLAPQVAQPTLPVGDNVVVQDRAAESQGKADAAVGQRGESLADFRSFGDLFSGLAQGQGDTSSHIGLLGGMKRGSQGILPLELQAAAEKGKGLRTVADMLNLGASITGSAALAGPDLPGMQGGGYLANLFGNGAKAGPAYAGAATDLPRIY